MSSVGVRPIPYPPNIFRVGSGTGSQRSCSLSVLKSQTPTGGRVLLPPPIHLSEVELLGDWFAALIGFGSFLITVIT